MIVTVAHEKQKWWEWGHWYLSKALKDSAIQRHEKTPSSPASHECNVNFCSANALTGDLPAFGLCNIVESHPRLDSSTVAT